MPFALSELRYPPPPIQNTFNTVKGISTMSWKVLPMWDETLVCFVNRAVFHMVVSDRLVHRPRGHLLRMESNVLEVYTRLERGLFSCCPFALNSNWATFSLVFSSPALTYKASFLPPTIFFALFCKDTSKSFLLFLKSDFKTVPCKVFR